MKTVAQLIREDTHRLAQINEGKLRNIGMAATVAAGLMGSPAQAAYLAPEYYSSPEAAAEAAKGLSWADMSPAAHAAEVAAEAADDEAAEQSLKARKAR